ncbi:DNA-3-methyladenine glycosylase [Natranaerobius thermophilus]|uniref:Putative 3-methyladenine DNA glycosylase n=1 Tax=Natranaerobius thermophilus (strain ATCC BAA-1301 / DSM 18059 / JW/NM-WN-LF) TaxID=457570 RepID=3MGH_NATTJ|nr:DNA-3-methyladenine glycosylase [Natranaerobius thermophilus]B2A7A8.1 RecName: Full=Putative 3-methyladenine DNA glycosylase [Natranaerobius thermophilus JW/NM-WN-LF]ACB84302.1 DNA-3-methyladenine glycosylase [Natranaerobius thermophilus JW/NM-WN-LF]
MKLDYEFFQRDAVSVAKDLIGKLLVRNLNGEELICRIVDTEAYCGPEDKGCHAYQNKRTNRTEVMYKSGGYVYVYLIYGLHYCFNVVVSKQDRPEAVFIRAGEPISGLKTMRDNRNIKSNKKTELTNGPGKLSQAMAIDKSLNGQDLVASKEIYLRHACDSQSYQIIPAKRVNIDYAEEYTDKLWRFYIRDNPFVSIN